MSQFYWFYCLFIRIDCTNRIEARNIHRWIWAQAMLGNRYWWLIKCELNIWAEHFGPKFMNTLLNSPAWLPTHQMNHRSVWRKSFSFTETTVKSTQKYNRLNKFRSFVLFTFWQCNFRAILQNYRTQSVLLFISISAIEICVTFQTCSCAIHEKKKHKNDSSNNKSILVQPNWSLCSVFRVTAERNYFCFVCGHALCSSVTQSSMKHV